MIAPLSSASQNHDGFSPNVTANYFYRWLNWDFWTPHSEVFDIGSSSHTEAVLKAVNLSDDTDTTAAVTGGLAGIYYSIENILEEWIEQIARIEDILDLATRLEAAIYR